MAIRCLIHALIFTPLLLLDSLCLAAPTDQVFVPIVLSPYERYLEARRIDNGILRYLQKNDLNLRTYGREYVINFELNALIGLIVGYHGEFAIGYHDRKRRMPHIAIRLGGQFMLGLGGVGYGFRKYSISPELRAPKTFSDRLGREVVAVGVGYYTESNWYENDIDIKGFGVIAPGVLADDFSAETHSIVIPLPFRTKSALDRLLLRAEYLRPISKNSETALKKYETVVKMLVDHITFRLGKDNKWDLTNTIFEEPKLSTLDTSYRVYPNKSVRRKLFIGLVAASTLLGLKFHTILEDKCVKVLESLHVFK